MKRPRPPLTLEEIAAMLYRQRGVLHHDYTLAVHPEHLRFHSTALWVVLQQEAP